jgi:hypothetical protein
MVNPKPLKGLKARMKVEKNKELKPESIIN